MLNKRFKLAIIFVLFLPITALAYKPAPSNRSRCQYYQQSLTEYFHKCGDDYNSKGLTPKVDTNSPSFTFETAQKFLRDNGYDDTIRTVSPDCKFDLAYIASGTKTYPNFKNFYYCKFHGSEEWKIKSSYPSALEKEIARDEFNRKLAIFLHSSFEYIVLGFIILFAIFLHIIGSKKKKTN